MPGKGAPAPCTGCPAPATNKPTYPFNDPLLRHVGRYVDSSSTGLVQNSGMRTIRAYNIRPYPSRNRLIIRLGETVGLYKLDTFFSSKAGTAMFGASEAFSGFQPTNPWAGRKPYEKILPPDRYFYSESGNSEWYSTFQDSQRMLWDSDLDDRGYLYVSTLYWGWGLAFDDGANTGEHVGYVTQVTDTTMRAETIFHVKVGATYYAVLSDGRSGLAIYDATSPQVIHVPNPQSTNGGRWKPPLVASRSSSSAAILRWARNERDGRLALFCADGHIRIYDPATFISGGAPLADYTASSGFGGLTFDDSGRVWATDGTSLLKISPNGAGYSKETFTPYNEQFSGEAVSAAGGYVSVLGATPNGYDVALLKLDNGTPRRLETDGFFRKYYNRAPSGYVALDFQSPSTFIPWDVRLISQNGKTFLMYSAGGLGDIYEVQGGDSISASLVTSSFGTPNPNAVSTEAGPYYGDILQFKATASSPNANYAINWTFGNPESQDNTATSTPNMTVSHQYHGIQSATGITGAKKVVATVQTDSSLSSELNVTLKVPTARITVPGRTTPMTQTNRSAFELIGGDSFKDASDGVIEGHYTVWSIDGVETKLLPNQTISAGAIGTHTVGMQARYGKYDATAKDNAVAFAAGLSPVSYTVKPFLAAIRAPQNSATSYTFNADSRVSSAPFLTATQWIVTWSIGASNAAGSVQTESTIADTSTVAVGTIPPFVVPKSSVHDGDVVKLQISVDPSGVSVPTYATYTAQVTLSVPQPDVTITSGCINAGAPCTLTAVSKVANVPTSGWLSSWSISNGTSVVASGANNPITFTPSAAGVYTATYTETSFGVSASKSFSIAAVACGPLPEDYQASISTDCTSCKANTPVQFNSNLFGYTVQACDTLTWTFGDGTTGTGAAPKHTYASNNTYNVTFKITNSNGSRTWTYSVVIGGSTPPPPPPTTGCFAPTGIAFSYTCSGSPCKVGDTVRFTATRDGGTSLLNCDVTTWTIDGTTYTARNPQLQFTSAGQKTVTLVVSNTEGTASPVQQTLTIAAATGNCSGSAPAEALAIEFSGPTSRCFNSPSSAVCAANEIIQFTPSAFGYTFQACDQFSWDFGDGSTSAAKAPTHAYNPTKNTYTVTLRVSNSTNPTGVTLTAPVRFNAAPALPAPQLTYAGFPTTGTKDVPVTFTVNSSLDATGWTWDFNDGVIDTTQASAVGKSSTISHAFSPGTYSVKVTARNAQAQPGESTAFTIGNITISDIPEYRYLLPVVTRIGGQNNSVWRTDVQIYNPDPNVSATKPLVMTATLRDIVRTLEIPDSTFIYEDFMSRFVGTNASDSGPVIITTRSKFAPQIWTRTYNQTETGTFGQFIPAIRLDNFRATATGPAKSYLAGLRNGARYRTNLGLVNPTATPVDVTIRAFDDRQLQIGQRVVHLDAYQLQQFAATDGSRGIPEISPATPFTIEIETPNGQWVIGYASFIDGNSNDPVYLQAVAASELDSSDYRTSIIPGVGHVGDWRSDVTIFNADPRSLVVDLAYFDPSGVKTGEAKNVLIRSLESLQYADILKQGIFGNVADGVGTLRVSVPSTITDARFPMVFARTYNDNGSGKTYGQGIAGFASTRPNVKPGKPALIAGVRSNSKYYTNVGITNVSDTEAVVTVTKLNAASGAESVIAQYTVKPNASVVSRVELGAGVDYASLKIETTGGNVWAFGSIIDKGTSDPEYVPATPLQ